MRQLVLAVYGDNDRRHKKHLDACIKAIEEISGEGAVFRSYIKRPTKRERTSPRWPCPTCGAPSGTPCVHVGGGLR